MPCLWGVWIILAEACARTAHRVGVECTKKTLLVGKGSVCLLVGIICTDAVFCAIGARHLQIPLPQLDQSGNVDILQESGDINLLF